MSARPAPPDAGRAGEAAALAALPRLNPGEPFSFVCAGCGDCCRARRDLLLSGYDLYRLARRLNLPPRLAANAFCRRGLGAETLLPTLRLAPRTPSGDCPFLDAGSCAVHAARPLACALYPLGQCIDLETGTAEYYLQPPLCGAQGGAGERTLAAVLADAGVTARLGTDVQWAKACTRLSARLQAAGGRENPHYKTAAARIERALYYDYSLREDFYPQFCENLAVLYPLLERVL